MIIDFHCHVLPPQFQGRHRELAAQDATYAALFPDQRGRTADVDALLYDMDAAGIDHAVIMGFGWTNQGIAETANNYLVSAGPDSSSATAPRLGTTSATVAPKRARPRPIRCDGPAPTRGRGASRILTRSSSGA